MKFKVIGIASLLATVAFCNLATISYAQQPKIYLLDNKNNIWSRTESIVPNCRYYHNLIVTLKIEKGLTHAYKHGAGLLISPLYTGYIQRINSRQPVEKGGQPFNYEDLVEEAQKYDTWNKHVEQQCKS